MSDITEPLLDEMANYKYKQLESPFWRWHCIVVKNLKDSKQQINMFFCQALGLSINLSYCGTTRTPFFNGAEEWCFIGLTLTVSGWRLLLLRTPKQLPQYLDSPMPDWKRKWKETQKISTDHCSEAAFPGPKKRKKYTKWEFGKPYSYLVSLSLKLSSFWVPSAPFFWITLVSYEGVWYLVLSL